MYTPNIFNFNPSGSVMQYKCHQQAIKDNNGHDNDIINNYMVNAPCNIKGNGFMIIRNSEIVKNPDSVHLLITEK